MQSVDKNTENKNVEEVEFSEEQTDAQLRMSEGDILQGLMDAAADLKTDTKLIQIARNGRTYFEFHIRPLAESEYEKCRTKHTKYVRNKQLGIKMPEDTDNVKYRSELIYAATTAEDKKKTWDNHKLWDSLSDRGIDILTGLDVIDTVLRSGEKDRIVDEIDKLSGYESSNLEEVSKN